MAPCVFFRYKSGSGDRYRLEFSDENIFHLVHDLFKIDRLDVTVLRGTTDDEVIDAGLRLVEDLASDPEAFRKAYQVAVEGLKDCRTRNSAGV